MLMKNILVDSTKLLYDGLQCTVSCNFKNNLKNYEKKYLQEKLTAL